jgi:hypothetical protein
MGFPLHFTPGFMISIEIMTTEPVDPAPEIEGQARKEKEEMKVASVAATSATSETLFVLLPFIVIGITLAHRGAFRTILYIPEWSIVSAIVGQSIVKVASTLGRHKVKKELIVLMMSVLLVCLLVPILIILAIALTTPTISLALAITQAFFFVLSALIFWVTSGLEITV